MAHSRTRKGVSIVQVSATQAGFLTHGSSAVQTLSVPAPIKGLDSCSAVVLIWTATDAHVFQTESGSTVVFPVSAQTSFAVNNEWIFQMDGSTVRVLSHEGVEKKLLVLDEKLETGVCLDCTDEYLALLTSTAYICIWKLEGSDITSCAPGSRCKVIPSSTYDTLRCNCDGSRLSFTVTDRECCGRIYVYDVFLDKVFDYNTGSSRIEHYWDAREPELLACQTRPMEDGEKGFQSQVQTFFVTSEHGLISQSKVEHDSRSILMGIACPFLHFLSLPESETQEMKPDDILEAETMEIFKNLSELESKTQVAILNFHLNIVLGNPNEAYRAVDFIQDKMVWENLAKFCVKSRLLEPAHFCLAKMHDVNMDSHGLHSQSAESDLAALAIQLGLFDEAEKLYMQSKRFDLLSLFYQSTGNWDKAIQVASTHDFVHLKNTHHAYAKYLESVGNIKAATKHYELSDTHRYEVPRMLFSLELLEELESYVKRSKDSELDQWWAHLCEANDSLRKAIEYYTAAGDIASVVRVYCYLNEFKAAADIASHYTDSSATFQLARQHEKIGNVQEALHFFTKAGRAGYAAKLAMKYGINSELLSLSLQSSKDVMILSAKYFEKKGMHEEAVLLYQKGGSLERAVDICIRSQLFDALKAIADDLDEGADPALLSRCGDFLLSHNQTEKAVVLYIAAKQHERALDLCISEGITITEKIAEQFTSTLPAESDSGELKQMVMTLAECCEAQGLFHLACKKYTQAGDRVKGMKALIKSGDWERIVLFANASRQKQLYILAADYLQTLDWLQDPNIMRTIVQLYGKAGEMDSIAAFYESCAQVEIDEFRDYEKALGAMKEAAKYGMKSTRTDNEERLKSLHQRISDIERFVKARRMAKTDAPGMIRACTELISECCSRNENVDKDETAEAAVRVGDIFALLIEYYFSQGNMEQAYYILQKMRSRDIVVDPYIDLHIVESIHKAVGREE